MARRQYWFRAKRYGWGWGLPVKWQGWVVLAVYFLLVGAGAWFLPPSERAGLFVLYVIALSALLCAVCYVKGEPPKWRWGGE